MNPNKTIVTVSNGVPRGRTCNSRLIVNDAVIKRVAAAIRRRCGERENNMPWCTYRLVRRKLTRRSHQQKRKIRARKCSVCLGRVPKGSQVRYRGEREKEKSERKKNKEKDKEIRRKRAVDYHILSSQTPVCRVFLAACLFTRDI